MNLSFPLVIIPLTLLITACADLHQARTAMTHNTQPAQLQLDTDIQQLLQQEMQAIQTGMMSLIPVIASGDWDKVAEIGKKLEGSYLLKQQLTTAQRHALHKSLPAEFIKLDQAFHRSAGMLAHAAEIKNADVVNFYFYKLNTACVECHTEFATEKFPALTPSQHKAHH